MLILVARFIKDTIDWNRITIGAPPSGKRTWVVLKLAPMPSFSGFPLSGPEECLKKNSSRPVCFQGAAISDVHCALRC